MENFFAKLGQTSLIFAERRPRRTCVSCGKRKTGAFFNGSWYCDGHYAYVAPNNSDGDSGIAIGL